MKQEFDAIARSRWAIQIRTKDPDGTAFYGIVLENKRPFVIIQQITGFELDGIVIIPKKWINGIRNGRYERCLNEILRNVINVDTLSISGSYIGLNNLREIVTRLQTESIWPAIEVLYKREASLYLGPITEASKSSFKIHCYDAAGEWEKEYELEYEEIFKIEIDSRYVRHFNEYMKLKAKPA